MAPLFFTVGVIAGIWSGVRSQILYRQPVDSFPPQFQDDLTSRYAFSVFALDPSTPLPLQAEYIKCQYAGCALALRLARIFLRGKLASWLCCPFFCSLFAAFTAFKS